MRGARRLGGSSTVGAPQGTRSFAGAGRGRGGRGGRGGGAGTTRSGGGAGEDAGGLGTDATLASPPTKQQPQKRKIEPNKIPQKTTAAKIPSKTTKFPAPVPKTTPSVLARDKSFRTSQGGDDSENDTDLDEGGTYEVSDEESSGNEDFFDGESASEEEQNVAVAPSPKKRRTALTPEEKELANLESKLHIKKGAPLPKQFKIDGLAYLLGEESDEEKSDYSLSGESEEEEDAESSQHEKPTKKRDDDEEAYEEEDEDDDDENEEEPDEYDEEDEDEATVFESTVEPPQSAGPVSPAFDQEGSLLAQPTSLPPILPNTAQSSPAPQGKYTPPHLRLAPRQINQIVARQVRGIVNRIADANLVKLAEEAQKLFSTNAFADVSEILNQAILDSCNFMTGKIMAKHIITHVAFLSVLHTLVGIDVGATFLELLATQFQTRYTEGKDCTSMILLFTYLYNFKIIHCQIIYGIIRQLVTTLTEDDTNLLLLLVQHCGQQLRKDDPIALKSIVLLVQQRVSKLASIPSIRMNFMLESLFALKNNRPYDSEYKPIFDNIWKSIYVFLIKHGGYLGDNELKISWEDLISPNKTGRWWMIGSAFTTPISGSANTKKMSSTAAAPATATEPLHILAKQHHMNTDSQKAVFCTLLSCSDYMEAVNKLLHMGLKGRRTNDIAQIIIYLCQKEKAYNAYYFWVSLKLCQQDKQFCKSFKFCWWDRIKLCSTSTQQELTNLAKLYANLIGHRVLNLTCIKVDHFEDISTNSIFFWKFFFATLLTSFETAVVSEVFNSVVLDPGRHPHRKHRSRKGADDDSGSGNNQPDDDDEEEDEFEGDSDDGEEGEEGGRNNSNKWSERGELDPAVEEWLQEEENYSEDGQEDQFDRALKRTKALSHGILLFLMQHFGPKSLATTTGKGSVMLGDDKKVLLLRERVQIATEILTNFVDFSF
ncbi:nucleolar protein with MIF4G domain 1 [Pelomyxa schiedti]|nr:nucleolar protein with MIF4G domain 1 [Pelomyxa schiedti]